MTTPTRKSRLLQMPKVGVDVGLRLTEPEVRALNALTVYGADAFLENFYKVMGVTYLKPHEAGLRSLFTTIGNDLRPILARLDNAHRAFAYGDAVIMSRREYETALQNARERGAQDAGKKS